MDVQQIGSVLETSFYKVHIESQHFAGCVPCLITCLFRLTYLSPMER